LEQLGQALIAPNCQASRIMYTICYLERAPKELRHMFLKTETPHHSVLPSLAVALLLVFLPAQTWGHAAVQPSTKNGEWPYYTGDARGSKYSPLDQINASPDVGGVTILIAVRPRAADVAKNVNQ
jgi:hypothetical protein